jgi:hypothetical protein
MYEFKKIQNNHNRLRDDVIIMDSCSPILKGQQVMLTGPPRDLATGGRMVCTSPVVDIDFPHANITRIITESGSIYEIKKL